MGCVGEAACGEERGRMLTREQTLEKLATIRRLVREIKDSTPSPAIERSMHLADMYCHLAQWQLGEVISLVPEVEP